MFKNKIIILSIVLVILIVSIILVSKSNKFIPPSFDDNARDFKKIPNEQGTIKVNEDYVFYIEGSPKIKDDKIYVNFYSLASKNIYLKVRVLQNDTIIAESGLLKSNEWIETIRLKETLFTSKRITYLIMAYEKDTYYSLGEVRLNFTLEG